MIIGLPVAAFILNGTVVRAYLKSESRVAGWITIGAVAGSFVISIAALIHVVNNGATIHDQREWITISGFDLTFGMMPRLPRKLDVEKPSLNETSHVFPI